MKRILITGFLCLAFSSADAFTTTITYSDPGPNTNAIGIAGLDIAGELWDITWDSGGDGVGNATDGNPADCRDIYAYSTCPTASPNSAGALVAAAAIESALWDDDPDADPPSTALTVGSSASDTFHIAYLYDDTSCAQPGSGTCTVFSDGFFGWGSAPAVTNEISLNSTVEIAKFSANVAVPVPPAVWLFGSALGMLGWIRHRSRQRST
jgi:hypothetical protein